MKQEAAQEIVEENKRIYNRIAEQFSGTRRHPWGEFTVFLAYVKSGDQVLDVGCGNGRLAGFLEQKHVQYTGVDASEALITAARPEHPHDTFQVAEAQALPFPDQQFDVVFLIATLHHIPSHALRQRVIAEARRVLKPGGYLIMTEWNLLHTQWWGLLLRYTLRKLIGRSPLDWGDVEKPWRNPQGTIMGFRYLHPFTRGSLGRLLRQGGFTPVFQRYTTKGNQSAWHRAYNLLTVAKKR